jgi:Leucine-rich repeat (LRR) protein
MMVHHQDHKDGHETGLEEISVETPAPPEFLPYESGGAAVTVLQEDAPTIDGTEVRHGRGPRFWLLIAGILVIVVAAVGGGVAAAMAGGDSSSSSASESSEAQSSNNIGTTSGTGIYHGTPSDSNTDPSSEGVSGLATAAPTSEVFDIILTHSRFHGLEFEDPNSYQSKAVKWVEQTADLTLHTVERLVQRYALACLYYATNGVENFYTELTFGAGNVRTWIDETGWLANDDECTWYKVTCNTEGFVTEIELDSNRLTGFLPQELTLLKTTLEVLDLYQNMFHNQGEAGNHWLGELVNLRSLFYARTFMEYPGIPTVIGLLTNLQEYDCSYTLYHGPLVGQTWSKLSNLSYLHIGGNRYNSTIPVELASMPNLEFFYAEFADLTGDLSFVSMMPEIVELWVDRNPMMHGTIPSEIGTVSTLKSLSVTDCSLEGTLPTELGNLRLTQFWCYNNSLAGSIPSEFGMIDELARLGLEDNNFSGTMPAEICNLRTPNGLLDKLEADCIDDVVTCSCCTCCGSSCSGTTPSARLLEALEFYSP